MSCEKIKPLLFEYFEKNISDENLRNLKVHLEVCERCSNELIEYEKFSELMKEENTGLLEKRYFYFENLHFNNSKEPSTVSDRKIPVFRFAVGFASFIFVGALLFTVNFLNWNNLSDEYQAARLYYPQSQSELINVISYENLLEYNNLISDETIIDSDYLKGEYEILLQMDSKFIPGVESYLGKEYNLNGLNETDVEQIINSLIKKELI
ncbi:MAG: zf-HC2 domain-containing protein [Bacteroidetes bacterium]|nr:zf-HC2 domain-containing protein [Bacteroidota bacterium]